MDGLLFGARILLGIVFVSSGALKLISPNEAAELLADISLLSLHISRILIGLVSVLEFVLGAMFFLRWQQHLAALISTIILLCFTMIGMGELQDPKACGCFGDVLDSRTDELFMARNMALLFVSMFLLRYQKEPSDKLMLEEQ